MAASGAVGSVAGDLFFQNWLREKLNDPDGSKPLTQKDVDALKARGVDISKLAAWLVAASVGLDVNTAARTGGNAAQHNILPLIGVALVLINAGLQAYDVYHAVQLCRSGNAKGAALIIAGDIPGIAVGAVAAKVLHATYTALLRTGMGAAAGELLLAFA